jgi:hypothetical protein
MCTVSHLISFLCCAFVFCLSSSYVSKVHSVSKLSILDCSLRKVHWYSDYYISSTSQNIAVESGINTFHASTFIIKIKLSKLSVSTFHAPLFIIKIKLSKLTLNTFHASTFIIKIKLSKVALNIFQASTFVI